MTLPDSLYEVVDGQIVEKVVGALQIQCASILYLHLYPFVFQHRLGRVQVEMILLIDPTTRLRRRPDVSFVSAERWPLDLPVPSVEAWEVVPDLAVEVVSPSNSASEVVRKIGDYFRTGVRLAWVVYPIERQVHVFESPSGSRIVGEGDELDGGEVIPGFRLAVGAILEPRPEG